MPNRSSRTWPLTCQARSIHLPSGLTLLIEMLFKMMLRQTMTMKFRRLTLTRPLVTTRRGQKTQGRCPSKQTRLQTLWTWWCYSSRAAAAGGSCGTSAGSGAIGAHAAAPAAATSPATRRSTINAVSTGSRRRLIAVEPGCELLPGPAPNHLPSGGDPSLPDAEMVAQKVVFHRDMSGMAALPGS